MLFSSAWSERSVTTLKKWACFHKVIVEVCVFSWQKGCACPFDWQHVTSKNCSRPLVVGISPFSIERWLQLLDVERLLYATAKPVWFPVQNSYVFGLELVSPVLPKTWWGGTGCSSNFNLYLWWGTWLETMWETERTLNVGVPPHQRFQTTFSGSPGDTISSSSKKSGQGTRPF